MSNRLFGTDGIRGKANTFPMTCEIALNLGRAVAGYFQNKNTYFQREKVPVVVVGKDTRNSCYMFEQAFCAGVCSQGGMAILTGPLPTPGVAFATQSMRASAGVMISASHNPFQDNGIKIFNSKGHKLSEEIEDELEKMVLDPHSHALKVPGPPKIGKATRLDEIIGRYIVHVKSAFEFDFSLEGLKIVIDCANGAGYKVGPLILNELGAEVIALNIAPNGFNINENCGSMHYNHCAESVLKHQADFGICLDGDADRVLMIDRFGKLLTGDHLLGILTRLYLKKEVMSLSTPVIGTVMSNIALENYIKSLRLPFIRTQVGDKYVSSEMQRMHGLLGGEPSGHLIIGDKTTTGDGILAALKVLEAYKDFREDYDHVLNNMVLVPQMITNIAVKHKYPLESRPKIMQKIKEVENQLGQEGRVLIRYSGTEDVVRIMLEGRNKNELAHLTQELSNLLTVELE